uniref:Uncharacterized protein n=1 Tax=Johnson-sea-linkia profunda TaxID=575876 RepID=A0A386AXU2_9CHLO|nr:hypothetical protein [Johnson-sea-linkia profunda]
MCIFFSMPIHYKGNKSFFFFLDPFCRKDDHTSFKNAFNNYKTFFFQANEKDEFDAIKSYDFDEPIENEISETYSRLYGFQQENTPGERIDPSLDIQSIQYDLQTTHFTLRAIKAFYKSQLVEFDPGFEDFQEQSFENRIPLKPNLRNQYNELLESTEETESSFINRSIFKQQLLLGEFLAFKYNGSIFFHKPGWMSS